MDIRVDKSADKTSFGWFYGTHKFVTRLALRPYSWLRMHQTMFDEFVVRPDLRLNERGLFGNRHFYCLKTKGSFLDFNGKGNAHARYKFHVEQMLLAIENEDAFRIIKNAAKALHFLQDVTQPHHTQEGFFFNKVRHVGIHRRFEQFVKENQKSFLPEHIEYVNNPREFEDIFMDNVKFSSKVGIPVESNIETDWERIGKVSLEQAVKSTREFLSKVDELIQNMERKS